LYSLALIILKILNYSTKVHHMLILNLFLEVEGY